MTRIKPRRMICPIYLDFAWQEILKHETLNMHVGEGTASVGSSTFPFRTRPTDA
jgi:hypothetical protein